jgi:DNA-directed RNA polymerase specialized sigma24 family protein
VLRYARRRIDRILKKVDLSEARDGATLATEYAAATASVDVRALVQTAEDAINKAIADQDAALLLRWYDNKGLLNIAAKAKGSSTRTFEQWLVRALRNGTAPTLSAALLRHLPRVVAA